MTDVATASVGTSGECLHVRCDDDADVAAICDTGQVKHYCDGHGHGRMAGHALVEEWVELPSGGESKVNDDADEDDVENVAEPTAEHVEERGYHKAAGQAQQTEAQRLFENDDS